MRGLKGRAVGLDSPVMGVITTGAAVGRDKKPRILLAREPAALQSKASWLRRQPRYEALVVPDNLDLQPQDGLPGVFGVPAAECAHLQEGDVVCLDPSGDIALLYKIGSPHNSILATNRCNCRCLMCPQIPASDPPGLIANNLKLISLMDPDQTESLGLTGGEPTLLGEDLLRLIRECRRLLPRTRLTLLTNGRILKDLDFARELVQAGYPHLFVEIPLFADNDTEHDAIMAAPGSFYDTLQGLHNLALLDQPLGLRTVLHALTYPRLRQYAEFVYRNLPFVFQVAFMGMETIGLARENLERLWVDPYEYRQVLAAAVRYLARRLVPALIYNHQLCLLPEEVWPFSRRAITTWKQLYLPLCQDCRVQERCGGLFGTGERHSAFLQPVR